jgi:hypothetical protein
MVVEYYVPKKDIGFIPRRRHLRWHKFFLVIVMTMLFLQVIRFGRGTLRHSVLHKGLLNY